jgi:hypothetical protein
MLEKTKKAEVKPTAIHINNPNFKPLTVALPTKLLPKYGYAIDKAKPRTQG